jgi:hypothetical protein
MVRKLRKEASGASGGVPDGWMRRSNQEWAVGFACDGLATGRSIRIRVLAIVDAFTRECCSSQST